MSDADYESTKNTLDGIIEKLANLEHERWSRWQNYMHSKCMRQSDGSLLVPSTLVERWERQMQTTYWDLTDEEKTSDRDQVQQYLPLILAALTNK